MRRLPALILMLLLAFSSSALAGSTRPQTAPEAIRAGSTAPDFTLKDLQGKDVTLSSLRGKVVFLNFWASWCPPCRAEMPSMERLNEVFTGKDFVMLAVNTETDEKAVRDYLRKNPHTFPVLLDSEARAQNLYGVFRFPETFLIGKDGKVLERYIGARDWSSVEFMRYVSTLVKD